MSREVNKFQKHIYRDTNARILREDDEYFYPALSKGLFLSLRKVLPSYLPISDRNNLPGSTANNKNSRSLSKFTMYLNLFFYSFFDFSREMNFVQLLLQRGFKNAVRCLYSTTSIIIQRGQNRNSCSSLERNSQRVGFSVFFFFYFESVRERVRRLRGTKFELFRSLPVRRLLPPRVRSRLVRVAILSVNREKNGN